METTQGNTMNSYRVRIRMGYNKTDTGNVVTFSNVQAYDHEDAQERVIGDIEVTGGWIGEVHSIERMN
jgi:hypothetical protein